jgi:ceramide glucosyltransferase
MLMNPVFLEWLVIACIVMAAAGCVYALGAAFATWRFGAQRVPGGTDSPGVTILKPLSGAESGLYDHLDSFCKQDYAGPTQILFGVKDATDAAAAIVERLRAKWPDRDLELVVDPVTHGFNPKVSNLVGMQRHIHRDIVILADSDIAVGPDYVSTIVAALLRPDVGLVTCLYRGAAHGGVWAQLASMAIDYRFLPDVLVGLQLGLARPCFGSTIALRLSTLQSIGGFEAFANHLADDNALGEAVRATGLRVVLPPHVVVHACPERTAGELLAHELRWARTLRSVSPMGYAGLVITHPLPFALIAAGVCGAEGWATLSLGSLAMAMIAASIACRLVLQFQVDHTLRLSTRRWWLGPARDMLSFLVYAASFFVSVVSWRGTRYKVRADGTLASLGKPKR